MLLGILTAVLAGILWTVFAAILSHTARRQIDIVALMALSAVTTLGLAWAVLVDYPALAEAAPQRLGQMSALVIVSGVLNSMGALLVQKAMRFGHHGMVWTMSQSGFILPFLTGVVLFSEPAAPVRLAGVGAILASVVCFGVVHSGRGGAPAAGAPASADPAGPAQAGPADPPTRSWFALAVLALVALGLVQALATVPSYWKGWTDRGHLRVPIYYIGVAGGFVGAMLLRKRRLSWRIVPWALVVSVNALFSVTLIFKSMDCMAPARMISMTYPIAVGTCMAAFAAYSLFVLREAVRPLYIVGLLLSIGGVVLAALR